MYKKQKSGNSNTNIATNLGEIHKELDNFQTILKNSKKIKDSSFKTPPKNEPNSKNKRVKKEEKKLQQIKEDAKIAKEEKEEGNESSNEIEVLRECSEHSPLQDDVDKAEPKSASKSVRFQNGTKKEGNANSESKDNAVKTTSHRVKKSKSAAKKSKLSESELEPQPFGICDERKWDDGKDRKMVSGKFTEREEIILRNAICEYARENNLSKEELKSLIEDTGKETTYTKAWVEISRSLRKYLLLISSS
jgi:hypothetical protein